MLDLGLAIAHHILVFGLVVMLAFQSALLSGQEVDWRRPARLDGGYGATAGLVIAVGVARVILGGKGWDFYEANPFFWAKVATFAAIGALSALPTLKFVAWTRAARIDPAFQPAPADVAKVRGWVRIELLLLLPLVAFAAAMARWTG